MSWKTKSNSKVPPGRRADRRVRKWQQPTPNPFDSTTNKSYPRNERAINVLCVSLRIFLSFLLFNWQIEKAAVAGLDLGRDRTELVGRKAPRHPSTSPSIPPRFFCWICKTPRKKNKRSRLKGVFPSTVKNGLIIKAKFRGKKIQTWFYLCDISLK